jgi:hypothetical protein
MKVYETKPIFRKLFLFLLVGYRTVALTSLYQLDGVALRPRRLISASEYQTGFFRNPGTQHDVVLQAAWIGPEGRARDPSQCRGVQPGMYILNSARL